MTTFTNTKLVAAVSHHLLTPEQVAEMLAVSKRQVYRLAAIGELRHVRMGKLVRFREADIASYVENSLSDG
jgi:excisionase family DNA binding protein